MTIFYEKCPECDGVNSWQCTWCDGEGYVEVGEESTPEPEPGPEQFYVTVFWKGDGADLMDFYPVSAYGPVPESNLFHLNVGVHHNYINLAEVRSLEISPFESPKSEGEK